MVDKKALTLVGARKVIAAGIAEAQRLHTTGAFAVVDDGGNVMAVERIDGTFAAGARISTGKARTAALFRKPTQAFEEVTGKGAPRWWRSRTSLRSRAGYRSRSRARSWAPWGSPAPGMPTLSPLQ